MGRRRDKTLFDKENKDISSGIDILYNHPLFKEILKQRSIYLCGISSYDERKYRRVLSSGYAYVTPDGYIHLNTDKKLAPEQWAFCLAHCIFHLCFNHFKEKKLTAIDKVVFDIIVTNFLKSLKLFGHPALDIREFVLPQSNEIGYLRQLVEESVRDNDLPASPYAGLNVAGAGDNDMLDVVVSYSSGPAGQTDWDEVFRTAVEGALNKSLQTAGGYGNENESTLSGAERARRWFISSYPLLAGLAASFAIVENRDICRGHDISVAAVCEDSGKIFINENFKHSDSEYRFLIAHLLLHVGLRHKARRMGRDDYLWALACDYVINQWLIEMKIGLPLAGYTLPGGDELNGLSAESIYDRLIPAPRKYRKLPTLRGGGLPDMIDGEFPLIDSDAVSLDSLFREYLNRGLLVHLDAGRGIIPASLAEEIKHISQPPIPWDVDLGRWFDEEFAAAEKRRTYGILNRRQYSTPDIPRPGYIGVPVDQARTFAVIFDTSLSMNRVMMAKGLGAVISFSLAKDIKRIRLVYCDAVPYDEGYILVEDLMNYVNVKGRGGTVLQPAIDLLESDEVFPKDSPILIITDGYCDRLRITRKHAFLLPEGHTLPFIPKGKVFRMS